MKIFCFHTSRLVLRVERKDVRKESLLKWKLMRYLRI